VGSFLFQFLSLPLASTARLKNVRARPRVELALTTSTSVASTLSCFAGLGGVSGAHPDCFRPKNAASPATIFFFFFFFLFCAVALWTDAAHPGRVFLDVDVRRAQCSQSLQVPATVRAIARNAVNIGHS